MKGRLPLFDSLLRQQQHSFAKDQIMINKTHSSRSKHLIILFLYYIFIIPVSYGEENLAAYSPTGINSSLQGAPILSSHDFVKQINSSCAVKDYYSRTNEQIEENNKNCVLSKVTFDYYHFFEPTSNKNNIFYKKDNFVIDMKVTKNKPDYSHSELELTLFTKKNNKIIDHLVIYKQTCTGEALECSTQKYYIDDHLNIWLLSVITDEEGERLKSYTQYKINPQSAKIKPNSQKGF